MPLWARPAPPWRALFLSVSSSGEGCTSSIHQSSRLRGFCTLFPERFDALKWAVAGQDRP
jgi:hypothetical protein